MLIAILGVVMLARLPGNVVSTQTDSVRAHATIDQPTPKKVGGPDSCERAVVFLVATVVVVGLAILINQKRKRADEKWERGL